MLDKKLILVLLIGIVLVSGCVERVKKDFIEDCEQWGTSQIPDMLNRTGMDELCGYFERRAKEEGLSELSCELWLEFSGMNLRCTKWL